MSARKNKLVFKYIVRRVLLLLVAAAVLGFCVWMAVRVVRKARDGPESSSGESGPLPVTASSEDSGLESEEPEKSVEPLEIEPEEQEPADQAADDSSGDWSLILVNKESPLPPDFAPPKLTHIVGEHSVDSRIAASVNRMFAAAKRNGATLVLCAAYQSDAGELQTGLAVDLASTDHRQPDEGFAETPAFRWLSQHAWEYGFVLRFPKNKTKLTGVDFAPWRYRYVGVQNARRMVENDYCFEEYIYVLNQEKLRATQEAQQPEDESAADESQQ